MKHVRQLDGIRCIAIVSVIIGHWVAQISENSFIKNFPWAQGVILFFVLSGFLITDILLVQKEKVELGETTIKKALLTFYFRRFIRIFPIYYLTLFFLYAIQFKNTSELLPWLSTFTTNILIVKDHNYLGEFMHFWSLAVEEQFYLFWPFIILLVNKKYLLKFIYAVIIISFLYRVASYFVFHVHWMDSNYFTLNYFLPLAFGALIAYYKRYNSKVFASILNNRSLFYASGILYFSFSALCITYSFGQTSFILDQLLFSFFGLLFVARASSSHFKSVGKFILENKPVVYIGKISYGLYIYHMFMYSLLLLYLIPKFDLHPSSQYIIWLYWSIMLLVIATASYFLIERPFNFLKRFFPY